MISVCKVFKFDAAHHLPGYEGPCKNIHGHSFRLEVEFTGKIQDDGMIIDFNEVKEFVNKLIIEDLDHNDLNELLPNPTAENLLIWILRRLKPIEEEKNLKLLRLRIYETENAYAEWRIDKV